MSTIFSYSGMSLLIMLAVRLVIIFFILPIHEFAHAFAAKKLGDNTATISGRLTLNPLSHVDPIGALFLILFGFGWANPVPINPRNFRNYKRDTAITAAAGPISNLCCAILAAFVSSIIVACDSAFSLPELAVTVLSYIYLGLQYFAIVNLSLAVFNLIPIEPLDGSRILSYFLPPKANAWIYKNSYYIRMALFLLVIAGAFTRPLSWMIEKLYGLIQLMFIWIEPLFRIIF